MIALVLKTGRPKGLVSSNLTPSATLVERAQEIDCITVSHNNAADFNGVQRCVAKSSFRIAHSLLSRSFKVCARSGRNLRKKEPSFFLGQRVADPTPYGRCWHIALATIPADRFFHKFVIGQAKRKKRVDEAKPKPKRKLWLKPDSNLLGIPPVKVMAR